MALSIGSADFGRDRTGLQALKKNLLNDIVKAEKSLVDASYNEVVTAVKNSWSGADADQFLKSFASYTEAMKKNMASYKAIVESTLDADAKEFAGFQNQNASNTNIKF